MPKTKRLMPNSIRHYRRRANLRLRDVANAVGLSSPAHLAHWERGRKVPELDYFLKLAAVLGVPLDVLYLERLNYWKQIMRQRLTRHDDKPL